MCGGKYITDASAKTVRKILAKGESVLLVPGGFGESVYTGASKDYDHVYLAGRVGFLKLAIERGIDVAPVYGFGVASAYSGLHMFEGSRHRRAVLSQTTGLPCVLPFGKFGSSVPYDESYVTVLLDPFPTSKYSLDQLEQCSQDYVAYLQRCFDAYKGCKASEAHKKSFSLWVSTSTTTWLWKISCSPGCETVTWLSSSVLSKGVGCGDARRRRRKSEASGNCKERDGQVQRQRQEADMRADVAIPGV